MPKPDPQLTPLEVMLLVMHRKLEAEDDDGAVKIAALAAPYRHPRRAPRPAGHARPEPDQMSDAELLRALRSAGAGVGDPTDDPEEPDGLG